MKYDHREGFRLGYLFICLFFFSWISILIIFWVKAKFYVNFYAFLYNYKFHFNFYGDLDFVHCSMEVDCGHGQQLIELEFAQNFYFC